MSPSDPNTPGASEPATVYQQRSAPAYPTGPGSSNAEFLILLNGKDDDNDGFTDEIFDGIDNDGDGIIDPGFNGYR